MNTYLPLLRKTTLFTQIPDEDILTLCCAFGCRTARYCRGNILWQRGDTVSAAGVVLCGSVRAERCGINGEQTVLARHGEGSLFGDVLMSSARATSPVDIVAESDTEVLFLPLENIMREGSCSCGASLTRFRLNLLGEISDKYWTLYQKIGYLAAPTLRAKLALWLLDRAQEQGSESVKLHGTQEKLAGELAANRSALTRELARMRDDGLVRVTRGRIEILDFDALRQCSE